MGLYDRDYARPGRFRWNPLAGWSLIATLILINVVVWGIDQIPVQFLYARDVGIPRPSAAWLLPWLQLKASTLYQPLEWYRFVTYGFVHDVKGVSHILFNMIGLYFFGRELEYVYGRRELLRMYLLFTVVSGVVWAAFQNYNGELRSTCVGASGAVMGISVLYACLYPWQTILINFFIPVPVCVAVAVFVLMDLMGVAGGNRDEAVGAQGGLVAHSAHLAGALCGYLYFYYRWNLTRLTDGVWKRLTGRSGGGGAPSVRLHRPDEDEPARPEKMDRSDLDAEVDRILKKMKDKGEESLTRTERDTLEEASRRYRDRHR